jgi:penicillin-binding protein 1A
MNLISATAASENSIFVQIAADLMRKFGDDAVIDMMHRMGFQSELAPIISAVLGTNLVNPLETASAYATFASGGMYREPQGVKLIKNSNGKVIYKAKVKGKRVISDGVAYYATQCMEAVITGGTGASNGYIGRPAAGKTGTTDSNADAWFCGFTPQLATAVWMGYPDARIAMNNVHGQQVWGGDYPTIIWSTFMRTVLASAPVMDFAAPTDVPDWQKWDGKYAGMSPSPSPSPSPSKTKKPKPKPTTAAPTVTPTLTPTPTPTPTPEPTPEPTPPPTDPPTTAPPTDPPTSAPPTDPPTSPVVRAPAAGRTPVAALVLQFFRLFG